MRKRIFRGVVSAKAPSIGAHGEEYRKKRLGSEHRVSDGTEPLQAPPIVHEVLSSAGKPLDEATRRFMEPRFGHDFSRVRVHTDSRAAESARAVNALAYTVGHNVVFDTGNYAPGTMLGDALLAHELTHTVQQCLHAGSSTGTLKLTDPKEVAEREANQAASDIWAGQPLKATPVPPTRVARQPVDYKSKI
jgi:Domain of unknown function (DUF4157)